MTPTLRRPFSFSTDLWLFQRPSWQLSAMRLFSRREVCAGLALIASCSDPPLVWPPPLPPASQLPWAPQSPALEEFLVLHTAAPLLLPKGPWVRDTPPPEARLCCPQMRIKLSTLGGTPGITGSVRREHLHVRGHPPSQYGSCCFFPSGFYKESKSREVGK